MLVLDAMIGPRASTPAEPADNPLRAALARGDRAHAQSASLLPHLLAAVDRSLITEAVVAQVRGMLADLAGALVRARLRSAPSPALVDDLLARLSVDTDLRAHCQALALEWGLAQALEAELALDPVLAPQLQTWVSDGEAETASLAMAALAAQARFAQDQRRMQLALMELPAELFHLVLAVARATVPDDHPDAEPRAEARLRVEYDEAATRQALFARLARETTPEDARPPAIEDAGVALWLSVLAARSGEARDRIACAAVDPHLGRLLLTLRAAGALPAESERQAMRLQPEARLPRGLSDVGTREAAQWLADARA